MITRYFGKGDDAALVATLGAGSVVIGSDPLTSCQELAFYVVFSEEAVGGEVVLESGPYQGYNGAWSPLATVEWVGPHRAHYLSVDGMHLAIRLRVTQPIINGTVSLFAVGG